MAIESFSTYQNLVPTQEVREMARENAASLSSIPRTTHAETDRRRSYLIANHDWPAVQTLQSDEDAYETLVAAFQQVDDTTYDAAMSALQLMETPPDASER